jgi:hypothetical protein
MRPVLIALAVAIVALAVEVPSSNAQGYNNRWCTDGGGVDEGSHLECSYYTLQQCEASARGRGQHCTENPDIVWGRARGFNAEQRRSGRQRDN